jgi:hypothetical protein
VAADALDKLHYSTFATVLVVIGYCLVALLRLEIPLIAFRFAPEQTQVAIDGAKAWASAHWRTIAIWGLAVIAAGFAIIGIAELL